MKKAFTLPLLVILFFATGEASRYTTVKKLRYSSYDSYTRVVVDLDGSVEYSENRLTNPDRLFFDLKNCTLAKSAVPTVTIKDGTLETVRLAQFTRNTVRVVLDLRQLKRYSTFMLEDPNRLVIDVYPLAGIKTPEQDKSVKTILPYKERQKVNTIVIDPGHGGKDPGAIGPGGLREKDITLSVSKKLGALLRTRHGVNVLYTREKDVFVPLNERTEIANAKGADLFISIHVNASEQRKARGIETYFLNWTDDREAIRVAARENRISFDKMQKVQSGLQMILQDLARNSKREESMRLAHSVQNSMVSALSRDYSQVENLGVKYALFYVLVGAEMPSVLAEVSFISNHQEERLLAKSSYRNRIAEAIADGIEAYISESTLIVKNAGSPISGG